MGLFDEYGVNMDEVKESSWEVPDDIYEFAVGSCWIQEGTKKDPDAQFFVIEYLLGDEGDLKKSEWFGLPADPTAPTDKELQKLGFLKTRLKSLGIPEGNLNDVDEDTLVGITGTLQIVTRNGFQNIRNVRVDEEQEVAEESAAEVEEEAPKAAPKVAARKAPAKAPAAKPTTQQRATAKGAVANPFARG